MSNISAVVRKAQQAIKSCIMKANDGTPMITPDGNNGYPALWTRDFAYIVENTDRLFSKELVSKNLDYLFRGISGDGAIPDRIDGKSQPWYVAGPPSKPMGQYNLDNAQFLVSAVYNYALKFGAKDYATGKLVQLQKALQTIPLSENGLVLNETGEKNGIYRIPHSTYGFYDTVVLTGEIFFCSLLLWQANRQLAEIAGWAGKERDAKGLFLSARKIEEKAAIFWNETSGIFNAATEIGRQPDIWGNVFALASGFPVSNSNRGKIVYYLLKNYKKLVYRGQLRHLPEGIYWEKLFRHYPRDTYQNGGYWGTPLVWLIKTVALGDKRLAKITLKETSEIYLEIGFCEWINKKGVFALPAYGATAAAFLSAVKFLKSGMKR